VAAVCRGALAASASFEHVHLAVRQRTHVVMAGLSFDPASGVLFA
jgi:hypothetical protein